MITVDEMLKKAEGFVCEEGLKEAKEDLKGLSLEEALKHPKAPGWAYWYACDVVNGRFIEAEKTIAANAEWAYAYARYVVKGRFPEAEKTIATDAGLAYLYARDVVKGRFKEGEGAIATDSFWATEYAGGVKGAPQLI